MAFTVNTNTLSMNAQSNLARSQASLNQSIQRLSSGSKINSAKDNAAGQAIANRMQAQINGLKQASANANDGISLAQTTEGALDQVNDNLQRIRTLTVQAQNGTNSSSDLQSIQEEINERLDEINRISTQTTFNGRGVLDGSVTGIQIQVGDQDGQTITLNLSKMDAETLDLTGFTVQADAKIEIGAALGAPQSAQPAVDLDVSDTAGITNIPGSQVVTDIVVDADGNYFVHVEDGGGGNDAYYALDLDADVNAGDGKITLDLSGASAATPSGTTTTVSSGNSNIPEITPATPAVPGLGTLTGGPAGSTVHEVLDANGGGTGTYVVKSGEDLYAATATANGNAIDVAVKTATYTDTSGASQTVDVRLGGLDGETEFVVLDGQRYLASDVNGVDLQGNPKALEGKAQAQPSDVPLATLDAALNQVDTLRSQLGAAQNRFESAIANIDFTTINLSAARSRIMDTDYAEEVSAMTNAQILQQAGTAVLAQANATNQGVLSLLG